MVGSDSGEEWRYELGAPGKGGRMDVSRLATKRSGRESPEWWRRTYRAVRSNARVSRKRRLRPAFGAGGRSLAGGRASKSAGSECVTVARRDATCREGTGEARRRKSSNARPNAAPFVDGRRPGCGRDGARRETDERAGRTAYCELRAATCDMRNTTESSSPSPSPSPLARLDVRRRPPRRYICNRNTVFVFTACTA